ncbi:polysaccharide deacetylase family protein [Simiduia sp. 21SJ11W-1]|uniref:polysaccharide deacetylase family protein n=1 Tax=Simiduia sp. 21SJ11W-1 TaxID=2909669 RepID=UPI00209C8723|nr:polysaccharide deacetylase family protein [Simiduia sp. 21SJ11W-1]UTA47747.1 polysaccharide deacetylase family protein [Simiduia sp. 21SJ11W-1]
MIQAHPAKARLQALCRSPLIALCLAFCLGWAARAQALVVLQYHHVSESTPASTSISPANFAEHMAHLKASGFKVIGLPELLAIIDSGEPFPDRTALITFDDAYTSVLTDAHPILQNYGWPYVVFASTEAVDQSQRHVMSWDQLRTLNEAGVAIANHSHTHGHLVRRPKEVAPEQWHAQVLDDLRTADARLKAELGRSWPVLAFPYGEFDAALVAAINGLGWIAFGQQSGAAARRDLPVLPRFPFGGRYVKTQDFSQKLKALPLPVNQLALLDEQGEPLADGVLPQAVSRPQLLLGFDTEAQARQVNCYVSGQGVSDSRTTKAGTRVFQAKTPLPAGRSRYNCTAPSGERGRYFWYSHAFLRPLSNGAWPAEP